MARKAGGDKQNKAKTSEKKSSKTKTPTKINAAQRGSRKGIGGRKALWDVLNMPSMLDAVKGWAMQGATDEDLAAMIGISIATFYEWKKKYAEFSEALFKGKHVANGELLNSAFRQSVGYTYIENVPVRFKTYKEFIDPDKGKVLKPVEEVIVVPVEKHVYPNATITQFMLRNRMPEQYKDKQQIEHIGSNDYDYLTDEELDKELEKLGGE